MQCYMVVYLYTRFIDYRDPRPRGFVKRVADKVENPYSEFIDIELYKS